MAEPRSAESKPVPSVRLIRGARDAFARHRGRFALALGVVIPLVMLLSGIYTVQSGESAALLRFGRLADDAIGPGLHLRLPFDRVTTVPTGEVLRHEVSGDFTPQIGLVTADENLIEVTLVAQYRVSRLGDFLYTAEDPRLLLEQVVRAALVESFASTPVDELLTSAKAAIQLRLREIAQERLEAYGAGVTVVAINLQTVTPPREAAGAFRRVSDARAEAARAVSEAESKRERSLGLARGQAGQLVQQAVAAAAARGEQANGAASRFAALLEQKRRAPGQTLTELYNETLQSVLPRARLILLAPGEKPQVDVQLLRRARSTPLPPMVDKP